MGSRSLEGERSCQVSPASLGSDLWRAFATDASSLGGETLVAGTEAFHATLSLEGCRTGEVLWPASLRLPFCGSCSHIAPTMWPLSPKLSRDMVSQNVQVGNFWKSAGRAFRPQWKSAGKVPAKSAGEPIASTFPLRFSTPRQFPF